MRPPWTARVSAFNRRMSGQMQEHFSDRPPWTAGVLLLTDECLVECRSIFQPAASCRLTWVTVADDEIPSFTKNNSAPTPASINIVVLSSTALSSPTNPTRFFAPEGATTKPLKISPNKKYVISRMLLLETNGFRHLGRPFASDTAPCQLTNNQALPVRGGNAKLSNNSHKRALC